MAAGDFYKTASGLLVPRLNFARGTPNPHPHPCPNCCPGQCASCTAENCEDTKAPCCFTVELSGIVAEDPEDCGDCLLLNDTYSLAQSASNENEWLCIKSLDCGYEEISLLIWLDGSDYKLTVTLGGHVWEKNYGTSKPNCCQLVGENIPHITDSTDCDTSGSECTVTANTSATAASACSCTECTVCTDSLAPSEVAVTASGVTGPSCCADFFDSRVFILPFFSVTNCRYILDISEADPITFICDEWHLNSVDVALDPAASSTIQVNFGWHNNSPVQFGTWGFRASRPSPLDCTALDVDATHFSDSGAQPCVPDDAIVNVQAV